MNSRHTPPGRAGSRIAWLLLLLLFPLFLGLGFWQLRRADEKRALREIIEKNLHAAPLRIRAASDLQDSSGPLATARQVEVTGAFDNGHQYLLDNQTEQGRGGYWVLTPLHLQNQGVLLVNRGWVAADAGREQVPEISVAEQAVTVHGRLVRPYRPALVLAKSEPERLVGGLTRIQFVQLPIMEAELGAPLLPLLMELDPASPYGYSRHWSVPVVNVERHTAYAVQWFALAILFLWIHWRGLRQGDTTVPAKDQD